MALARFAKIEEARPFVLLQRRQVQARQGSDEVMCRARGEMPDAKLVHVSIDPGQRDALVGCRRTGVRPIRMARITKHRAPPAKPTTAKVEAVPAGPLPTLPLVQFESGMQLALEAGRALLIGAGRQHQALGVGPDQFTGATSSPRAIRSRFALYASTSAGRTRTPRRRGPSFFGTAAEKATAHRPAEARERGCRTPPSLV